MTQHLTAPVATREAYCTSGPSPTLHLIGVGQVGRALLGLLDGHKLVGATDSTGTLHAREGLDPFRIRRAKRDGERLVDQGGAEPIPVPLAIDLVGADVVIDATATGPDSTAIAVARGERALRRGARLVLASKFGLAAAPHWHDRFGGRLGYNAVLGGTGRRLAAEREELRDWRSLAIVGNASTTAILERIEGGHDLEAAIEATRNAGLLEADAELDLDGSDAAVKLSVVLAALTGSGCDPANVVREDLRDLDVEWVRAAARRGRTTRLVARGARDGAARVRYEQLPRTSPLAVPADRVVYGYQLRTEHWRLHTGVGLGPVRTAFAIREDLGGGR